jgi:hypothetical protein
MEWFDPFQVYGMYTWKLIPKRAKEFCQFHTILSIFSWCQNVPNNFVDCVKTQPLAKVATRAFVLWPIFALWRPNQKQNLVWNVWGLFWFERKKNDFFFHILRWKNHMLPYLENGFLLVAKIKQESLLKIYVVSNPLIAKCGSLLLWMIANPLYKIGTQKKTLVAI